MSSPTGGRRLRSYVCSRPGMFGYTFASGGALQGQSPTCSSTSPYWFGRSRRWTRDSCVSDGDVCRNGLLGSVDRRASAGLTACTGLPGSQTSGLTQLVNGTTLNATLRRHSGCCYASRWLTSSRSQRPTRPCEWGGCSRRVANPSSRPPRTSRVPFVFRIWGSRGIQRGLRPKPTSGTQWIEDDTMKKSNARVGGYRPYHYLKLAKAASTKPLKNKF